MAAPTFNRNERTIIPSLMIALAVLLAVAVFTTLWYEHERTREDFVSFAAADSKVLLDTVVEAIQTTAGIRQHLQRDGVASNIVRDVVREFGTGRFLQRLGRYGVFDYLVCQDLEGIVAAYGVTNLARISSEPFLREAFRSGTFHTRMIPGEGITRLEAVKSFDTDQRTYLLRICMRLGSVDELQMRMVRRLVLLGAVFVFVVLLLTVYLITVNNTLVIARERDVITRRVEHMQRQMRQQERVHAMGRLAAGVAHEIRNPLNAAQILVQRLTIETTPEEASREKFEKFTRVIREELDRLNRIVEEFLGFARTRAPVFKEMNPAQVVRDVCTLEQGEAAARDVTLAEDIAADIMPIDADRSQLHQALMNIVRNAIEAAEPGDQVTARVFQRRGMTTFAVDDTGPGMSEDALENAFDLYYSTKESGTGLGLAITQRIVQQHDGEIRAERREPRGTSVSFDIPDGRSNADTGD